MSEVIEQYIRRNTGMNEASAFEGFLEQDRIKAWVGDDQTRRDRLRNEFSRVWASLHPPSTNSRTGTMAKQKTREEDQEEAPRERPRPQPRRIPVETPQAPVVPQQRIRSGAAPRKLDVLCPVCAHHDVWMQDSIVTCRHCSRTYEDMLELIPVKPVGPFEYMFGGGVMGVAKAASVAAGLSGLYLLLRWLAWA